MKLARLQGARKSQIALWMLTKFAMIFFILALALILTSYGSKEKASLCQGVAQATANSLRSALVNVLSSPVEDELKVIPLESALSVGKEDYESYEINITDHSFSDTGGSRKALIIEVLPLTAKDCFGGANVPYEGTTVHFRGAGEKSGPLPLSEPRLQSIPSNRTWKTLYLVLIKCGTKSWPPEKHLFMEACSNPDPNTCMNFNKKDLTIESCCGWSRYVSEMVNGATKCVLKSCCSDDCPKEEEDIHRCNDGSYVWRTPPDCNFVCPVT